VRLIRGRGDPLDGVPLANYIKGFKLVAGLRLIVGHKFTTMEGLFDTRT
jgi:hypothetical protein